MSELSDVINVIDRLVENVIEDLDIDDVKRYRDIFLNCAEMCNKKIKDTKNQIYEEIIKDLKQGECNPEQLNKAIHTIKWLNKRVNELELDILLRES